jgi:hypothetical protein
MKKLDSISPVRWLAAGILGLASLSPQAAPKAPKPAAPAAEAPAGGGFTARTMADALHTVISADRAVYTKMVVNRLANEEQVIEASEHWQEEKALPLPAQMLRAGAEIVEERNAGFSYALLSLYPINSQNNAKTDLEKQGLEAVAKEPAKNFYGEETLGGKRYFTAVYADKAVSEACVACHNHHKDSPKKDFKLNDVMGGIVIRIPAN